MNRNYRISSVTPSTITIDVLDPAAFKEEHPQPLTIGTYLHISDDNGLAIIAIVRSYAIKEHDSGNAQTLPTTGFTIAAQPVGYLDANDKFRRGGQHIAIPPTIIAIADDALLKRIYEPQDTKRTYAFGTLAQHPNIRVKLNGDRFFGKHLAVIGSTGSGKSCTVAKILQEATTRPPGQPYATVLNNAHIIIFDLHGEYYKAFPKANYLPADKLHLPYWLMNADELEELFIDRDENAYNQSSQFKHAVTQNKRKYNPGITNITYDTPIYFSLQEVYQYLKNQNNATKDAKSFAPAMKMTPALQSMPEEERWFEPLEFEEKAREKINDGPYYGDFHRFLTRLEIKRNDERLHFLLNPQKATGEPYKTPDLEPLLRQFLGYTTGETANITIVDLSGIPFEVLSIVVSLISRLVFDFARHYKKTKNKSDNTEIPILLVYEEAHNYVPNYNGSRFNTVKTSVERIAKEGRKYGVSLMIVSQRPSEISETIFSQCNNFVAMRLTNPADQQYVKRLLPDDISGMTDSLCVLDQRECLIIGDATVLPTFLTVDELALKPDSEDMPFHREWQKDWYDAQFTAIVQRMTQKPRTRTA